MIQNVNIYLRCVGKLLKKDFVQHGISSFSKLTSTANIH